MESPETLFGKALSEAHIPGPRGKGYFRRIAETESEAEELASSVNKWPNGRHLMSAA